MKPKWRIVKTRRHKTGDLIDLCEHCGQRIFGRVYKVVENVSDDEMYVDSNCAQELTFESAELCLR